jgi:hypothetical protein
MNGNSLGAGGRAECAKDVLRSVRIVSGRTKCFFISDRCAIDVLTPKAGHNSCHRLFRKSLMSHHAGGLRLANPTAHVSALSVTHVI